MNVVAWGLEGSRVDAAEVDAVNVGPSANKWMNLWMDAGGGGGGGAHTVCLVCSSLIPMVVMLMLPTGYVCGVDSVVFAFNYQTAYWCAKKWGRFARCFDDGIVAVGHQSNTEANWSIAPTPIGVHDACYACCAIINWSMMLDHYERNEQQKTTTLTNPINLTSIEVLFVV